MDQNLIRDLEAMADSDNKAFADVAYAAKVEIVRLTAMLNARPYAEICDHSLNVAKAAVCVRAAETARIMGRSWGYQWSELGDAIAEAILKGQ